MTTTLHFGPKPPGVFTDFFRTTRLTSSFSPKPNFGLPKDFFFPKQFNEELANKLSCFVWKTKTVRDCAEKVFSTIKAKVHPTHVSLTLSSKSWGREVLLQSSHCLYCYQLPHFIHRITCNSEDCEKNLIGKLREFQSLEQTFDKRLKLFYFINYLHENNYLPLSEDFDYAKFLEFLEANEAFKETTTPSVEILKALLIFLQETPLETIDVVEDEKGLPEGFSSLEENGDFFQILGGLAIYLQPEKS